VTGTEAESEPESERGGGGGGSGASTVLELLAKVARMVVLENTAKERTSDRLRFIILLA
jgi:hypothetical protein